MPSRSPQLLAAGPLPNTVNTRQNRILWKGFVLARIRTIKPEFCESESVGKLSREARLLFILLWTFVDDSGRSRASSRLLASRLYPYDDDAPKLISGWLGELEQGQHIRLYEVDGDQYLDIPKWLKHQKIDHPGKSRFPEFREDSREFREDERDIRASYLGPRTIGPRTIGPSTKDLPLANANGHSPEFDPVKALFDDGVRLLRDTGTNERQARSLIGKWRKSHGDEATREAIQAAYDGGIIQPVEWIEARMQAASKPKESWNDRRIREAREAIA